MESCDKSKAMGFRFIFKDCNFNWTLRLRNFIDRTKILMYSTTNSNNCS